MSDKHINELDIFINIYDDFVKTFFNILKIHKIPDMGAVVDKIVKKYDENYIYIFTLISMIVVNIIENNIDNINNYEYIDIHNNIKKELEEDGINKQLRIMLSWKYYMNMKYICIYKQKAMNIRDVLFKNIDIKLINYEYTNYIDKVKKDLLEFNKYILRFLQEHIIDKYEYLKKMFNHINSKNVDKRKKILYSLLNYIYNNNFVKDIFIKICKIYTYQIDINNDNWNITKVDIIGLLNLILSIYDQRPEWMDRFLLVINLGGIFNTANIGIKYEICNKISNVMNNVYI